jgi:hypothetical protein
MENGGTWIVRNVKDWKGEVGETGLTSELRRAGEDCTMYIWKCVENCCIRLAQRPRHWIGWRLPQMPRKAICHALLALRDGELCHSYPSIHAGLPPSVTLLCMLYLLDWKVLFNAHVLQESSERCLPANRVADNAIARGGTLLHSRGHKQPLFTKNIQIPWGLGHVSMKLQQRSTRPRIFVALGCKMLLRHNVASTSRPRGEGA